jgi:zinc D-Ala-D-Ala dipeptidase
MPAAVPVLILLAALTPAAPAPPVERGPHRPADLVELVTLEPSLRLDIRYATDRNFLGRAVYGQARAFLQRPAAEALVRAHARLARSGHGLLVFDAYRPWRVTLDFWQSVSPGQRAFVADPAKGSKHNRGCAVDVSLFERASGAEVGMPSAYDEMSERAGPRYRGGSAEQRRLRDLLRRAMESEGFSVEHNEWWHFNYKDWRHYPLLDVPFEAVTPRTNAGR